MPGSEVFMKEDVEWKRASRQEEEPKMLASLHDVGVAAISPRQLWLPPKDLHKTKPVKIQAQTGERPPGSIPVRGALGS